MQGSITVKKVEGESLLVISQSFNSSMYKFRQTCLFAVLLRFLRSLAKAQTSLTHERSD